MKSIFCLIGLFLFPPINAISSPKSMRLAANLGMSFVSPTSLNTYREHISSTIEPSGKFDKFLGYTISLGKKAGEQGRVSLEYMTSSQKLPDSSSTSSSTLVNSFIYNAVYIMYDYRLIKSGDAYVSVGIGAGKSLNFDYYETLKPGGDETVWTGSAYPLKVRMTYESFISTDISFFVNVEYENVSTGLKAKDDYTHGSFGNTITKDQDLTNSGVGGSTVTADLSGIRAALGFAASF